MLGVEQRERTTVERATQSYLHAGKTELIRGRFRDRLLLCSIRLALVARAFLRKLSFFVVPLVKAISTFLYALFGMAECE